MHRVICFVKHALLLEFRFVDLAETVTEHVCHPGVHVKIRSVCTEAGMYAIRALWKTVTEKDFLDAVNKVIKGHHKFSATPKYMLYN